MKYKCPVCLYSNLPYPPRDYHICPCCGTEFGNDDQNFSHAQLREMWIAGGAQWFFGQPPEPWNPWMQLIKGDLSSAVPKFAEEVTAEADATISFVTSIPPQPLILLAA